MGKSITSIGLNLSTEHYQPSPNRATASHLNSRLAPENLATPSASTLTGKTKLSISKSLHPRRHMSNQSAKSLRSTAVMRNTLKRSSHSGKNMSNKLVKSTQNILGKSTPSRQNMNTKSPLSENHMSRSLTGESLKPKNKKGCNATPISKRSK